MDTTLIGILIKITSVTFVVLLAVAIKTFPDNAPISQLMFFRVFLSIPFVIAFAYWQNKNWTALRKALTPNRFSLHLRRSFMGMTGMGLTFASLQMLPLPIAQSLKELNPVLITLFAALFLGETIRIFRTTGLILGLIGVALIATQTLFLDGKVSTDDIEFWGIVTALGAAIAIALTQIHIRSMVATENPTAIVFWFFIITSLVCLCFLPFGWIWPSAQGWTWLFLIGLLGAGGQLTLTSAYKFAEASTIAPFEYFSIPLALFIGGFFFGEWPHALSLLGIGFILAGGLIIIYREGQMARRRRHDLQNISRSRVH